VAGKNASNTNVVATQVRLGRKEICFAINISYLLTSACDLFIAAKHVIPTPSSP
jgi:hypothetical protein